MKHVFIKILIVIIFLIPLFSLSQEKKPAFILYDNGTWEKVIDNKIDKEKKSITEVWIGFVNAVDSSRKDLLLSYFKFPINIELSFENNCKRPICKNLSGACSKSKFESNMNIIFDSDFISALKKVQSDEFIEGKSEIYNKTNYTYQIRLGKDKAGISENNIMYEILFAEFNDELKIYMILAGFE